MTAENTTGTPPKRARLTGPQRFKVYNWANSSMEKMATLTRLQCSTICTHDMGFTVSVDQLKGVFVDMGIKPPWKVEKSSKNANRSMALANALLVIHDVLDRMIRKDSVCGLLPEPQLLRLQSRLNECDVPKIQLISRKEPIS